MREDLKQKVDKSIQRLQTFCPPEGYYFADSGGKDSSVCRDLLIKAGCKYDAHYRVTGIDPPELVKFIRENHPETLREVPRDKDGKPITMWKLIERKLMPPTRIVRYCCKELKEAGGDGRMVVTGVRWAESRNRKENQGKVTIYKKENLGLDKEDQNFKVTNKGGVILVNDNEDSRRVIESCYKRNKTTVNPIIEWEDADVWDFIREEKVPYCGLYDEGFTRLGCIGCPMARRSGREMQFARWPKFKNAYILAFGNMLKQREKRGLTDTKENWKTPIDVFNWWMENGVLPGQINLFDYGEDTE